MTTSATGSRGEQSGLGPFVIGVVAALAAGLIADALKLQGNTAAALSAIAGMTPNAMALLLRSRRIGRDQELEALSRGDLARPPLLVVGVLGPALWLIENFYTFFVGFVVGFSVEVTGGDDDRISLVFGSLTLIVVVPLLVFSTYLLAQYATHYLAQHAMLWLAFSVGLFIVFGLLTDTIALYFLDASDSGLMPVRIAFNVALLALLVFVSWLGKQRAESIHSQFVVVRLFRRLETRDRAAALDLLREVVLTQASARP